MAYDEVNYGLLTSQLLSDHHRITPNNRAQLLDDTFVLASTHRIPYPLALELSMYLKVEREYVPWNAVLGEFNYIDSMLYTKREYPDWKVI